MKHRNFRSVLSLALSAVASVQVACSGSGSGSGQSVDTSGGAVSYAGASGLPGTTNGGTGSGVSGMPDAGSSGSAAGMAAGGTSPAAGGTLGLAGNGGAISSGGSEAGGVGGSSGGGGQADTGVAFVTDRVVVSGVRGTASPVAASTIQLHNGGRTAASLTSLAISGANQALFRITSPADFPAMLGPGADLAVTLEMTTTGSAVPAAPANKDQGSVLLSGTLTATLGSGAVTASVFGLVLTQANYEPTLGQVLTTLGYKLNVGKAQTNWNPNTSMDATTLPGVETGSDEVAASRFVKAGAGNVGMMLVARFSPVGELPYGWYLTTTGCPAGCTTVGTMARVADAQTSDKARMVFPPLKSGSLTEFDPGSAPFGIWIYSDQKTQKFMEGGNMANGDWDYSQDALNSPANAHRFKSYPLKDVSGAVVPKSYLVAVEEAGNGDYQDYVFVLSNVTAMP